MTGLSLALIAVTLLGRANRTMAAAFVVNSTGDVVDASPGDGACELAGRRTLRAGGDPGD